MTISSTPKWKLAENVVAAIERSLNAVQGARVISNTSIPERISGVARQVDVYVEIPTGPRNLRVGVEVRDKTSPLDLPEIEQLIAKLNKLDVDYGCVVSRSGFTENAREEALRGGVELRTLAEVRSPDWWLLSAMSLGIRQVQLVRFQINFQPEELPQVTSLLAGAAGTDLKFILPNGETTTLNAFVEAYGLRAIDEPQLAHLTDQETFGVTMDFRDLKGASIECARGSVPLPQSVFALYRLHHRVESVNLASYEGEQGVNAFTGVSSNWNKQITLVTKLHPDGRRSLYLATDDPTAPKTVIGHRRDNDSEE